LRMKYTSYGNTGVRVSRLGFGAMRLPTLLTGGGEAAHLDMDRSVEILRLGIDLGINYLDSAWGYNNGESEQAVGKAIKGYDRSRLYIATKKPIRSADGREWRRSLEIQLRRLDTDYIDFYHFHNIPWLAFENFAIEPGGPLEEAHRALNEGSIRHLSFSSHDSPENITRLIDTGEFSTMLVQYNLLFRLNESVIAYAHSKGMGVAVMGPVMGGRLIMAERMVPSGNQTVPNLALRFVLSNPGVSLALSGMGNAKMVRENVATVSDDTPLSEEDRQDVEELRGRISVLQNLYCTGCGYCMPCPNGVDIPGSFLIYNYACLYDVEPEARIGYMMPHDPHPEDCIECEECLDKCPQNIPIPDKLKEVVELLEAEKARAGQKSIG
jgi:predicted aldo/keto reductase-like oxidoreductase